MADQDRYDPLERSEFFDNGMASRPVIEGTVARGQLRTDAHLYEGRVGGELASTFPMAISMQVLERGRERFDIYCSPCHGRVGLGNGIIVQRGFRRPSSFHVQRLQEAPPGHFFDVMTNGFGAMSSYAAQVPVNDRWAITAYIRALQLSQNVPLEMLGEADLQQLGAGQ